ncbi:putative cholesterol desaturase daf-36-like [Scophthalmus maximus]|uniref:cholesterol 7-desaturase n=1 Tax=Scophthalmus maximus TaxID=52904 RepID=A0A2U9CEQ2_SCOMX|nr:putative cholesterol desaturase daf-36-like [Scophthalmus maximus]
MSAEKRAAAVVALAAGAALVTTPLDSGVGALPLWSAAGPRAAAACALAALAVVAAWRLCRLLFGPLVILRTADDVGYVAESGRSKAQAANEARRRRRTGDLPPVYPNGWYKVLDSCALRRGDVKNVTVLGEQVAVFRGEDGEAHVLDAYCAHLGANLAVGGQVKGNCLECPFHGWQYSGSDGKCVKIPYAEKVPEFAKVRHWHSCEVNKQILVWFHCDGEDPQWAVPEIQQITKGEWVYRGRSEHFINAHIQEIPENAGDFAHLSHLHKPGIISGTDLRYIHNKILKFFQHDWKLQWEPESKPNQHCSTLSLKHCFILFGRHVPQLDLDFVATQMGPGVVFLQCHLGLLGRGAIIQCVTPVEPLLQHVTHTIFYQSNMLPLIPKFILKAETIQFERDVMIWNNKKYISKPLIVKEDAAIQKHRRWFSQFYSENSPRMQYQRDNLDF